VSLLYLNVAVNDGDPGSYWRRVHEKHCARSRCHGFLSFEIEAPVLHTCVEDDFPAIQSCANPARYGAQHEFGLRAQFNPRMRSPRAHHRFISARPYEATQRDFFSNFVLRAASHFDRYLWPLDAQGLPDKQPERKYRAGRGCGREDPDRIPVAAGGVGRERLRLSQTEMPQKGFEFFILAVHTCPVLTSGTARAASITRIDSAMPPCSAKCQGRQRLLRNSFSPRCASR